MIKFSVLVPTYNNLDYLKLAIKSIKEKLLFYNELLKSRDGFPEGTKFILESKKLTSNKLQSNKIMSQ